LPIFGLFGAMLAEVGLLCTWLVFASGSFWFRAASSGAAALILWICWAAGLLLAAWIDSWGIGLEMLPGSFVLPLVALATQSSLWLARCYSAWRLVHRESDSALNS